MFYSFLSVVASLTLLVVGGMCLVAGYKELDEQKSEGLKTIGCGVIFLLVAGLYYFLVVKG